MARRPRTRYTESQKALMWDRWQRGESLHQIAQLFDRHLSSVRRVLAETGGMRPTERHRAERCLSMAEREEISRALVAHESIRSIATRLQRAPSTVSREIQRNKYVRFGSEADLPTRRIYAIRQPRYLRPTLAHSYLI